MFCDLRNMRLLHTWSAWKTVGRSELSRFSFISGTEVTVDGFVRQERWCQHCNVLDIRDVKIKDQ